MSQNDLPEKNQFLLYTAPSGHVKIGVLFRDETIWLTQRKMAELFGCTKENIILHLKNIFSEGELSEFSTTKDFSVVQKEEIRKNRFRFF